MSRRDHLNSFDDYLNLFPNDDGLSYEDQIDLQENMYQSFQERSGNNNRVTHDGVNDPGHGLVAEGEHVRSRDVLSFFAVDEDMARSLEALGDELDNLFAPGQSYYENGTIGSLIETPSPAQASSSNSRHDSGYHHQGSSSSSRQHSVDLDTMQYEDLLQLTESHGAANTGISASRISQFKTSKYNSGGCFSSKPKETCVICQMDFKSGELLITLPCKHYYHSECISKWLMLKKANSCWSLIETFIPELPGVYKRCCLSKP